MFFVIACCVIIGSQTSFNSSPLDVLYTLLLNCVLTIKSDNDCDIDINSSSFLGSTIPVIFCNLPSIPPLALHKITFGNCNDVGITVLVVVSIL